MEPGSPARSASNARTSRAGARVRRELGIAHIPEDRHRRGLLLDFDLAENSILGVHYRKPVVAAGGILLDQAAIRQRALAIIAAFDVRPPNPDLPARVLSGGNQQKLVIGRELEVQPGLLLVSTQTRGVDIMRRVHPPQLSATPAARCCGCPPAGVVSLSDRLMVIHQGRIVGDVDPRVATVEEIGLLMTRGH